jgi:hypothetical protein
MRFNESRLYVSDTLIRYSYICRLSKTIPADVTDFLKFMNHRTGAVFIAFAAYNNEDGEQIYAR